MNREQPSPARSPGGSAPLVVVTGPTAAGKSHLALELATDFGGEIVNADSMQVYRGLDIGTAKPTPAERLRVVHHLIDVVDPDASYSAGRYGREAEAAVAAIHARGRAVFVTGGSGLYIRALLEGLHVGGVAADPALRAGLEREHAEAVARGDPESLHRRLAAVDPARAARLHPRDLKRIVRALEIHVRTGRPASALRRPKAPRFAVLHLALDPGPAALARRIDARCEQMIAAGLLQEVRELRARGYGPELPCMQGIGYRHMQPVLDGHETLANVVAAMKRDTRQFARRQRTWLRAIPGVSWVSPDDRPAIHRAVGAFLAGPASGPAEAVQCTGPAG